ncbi:MAG: hypothetical protein Q8N09_08780 [Thermodesulfovibrionia bacterium]|nr:hypothetical protein [Thermodesulfovibrionia bacterium]
MKKTIAILISVLLVVAFGTVVFAAQEAAAPAEKKEAAPAEKKAEVKTHQVTGEVAAVDTAANTVTVKKDKKEIVLVVTDKTKITLDKEKKGIADLKAGEKVTAKYTEEGGKNTAKSIAIAVALKAKEEPAKPAAEPAPKK